MILDSLSSQLVPPEFYQTSSDSSLFGSQHGSDSGKYPNTNNGGGFFDPSVAGNGNIGLPSPVSPSATIKDPAKITELKANGKSRPRSRNEDRSYWKTLRDFVDDKSIEDTLDMIDNDRLALDVRLPSLYCYPLLNDKVDRPEQNR